MTDRINYGDEWYTPEHIIKKVHLLFGVYDFLDPASNDVAADIIKAQTYYIISSDGLSKPWHGKVWLNPPYSKPLCMQFTEKLISEYSNGNVSQALVLTNNRTETIWYQRLANHSYCKLDFKGRLKFWTPGRSVDAPRHGQTLFYFPPKGDETHYMRAFYSIFKDNGTIWRLYKP